MRCDKHYLNSIHILSKDGKSVRECVTDSNNYNTNGRKLSPMREGETKSCMFRKGHIYLRKFQESFLRLLYRDVQTMEMRKGTRQTAAWGTDRDAYRYQRQGEESPLWPSVIKRKYGKWEWSILGLEHRYMSWAGTQMQTPEAWMCMRSLPRGHVKDANFLAPCPKLYFFNEDFKVIPKQVTSETFWANQGSRVSWLAAAPQTVSSQTSSVQLTFQSWKCWLITVCWWLKLGKILFCRFCMYVPGAWPHAGTTAQIPHA